MESRFAVIAFFNPGERPGVGLILVPDQSLPPTAQPK